MGKDKVKFIYISSIDSEGAIFQTQVVDWLKLFREHGISFELIRLFQAKEIFRIQYIKKQVQVTKNKFQPFGGCVFFLPERTVLNFLNAFFLLFVLFKYFLKAEKVVVFSRYGIGKEVRLVKKFFPKKFKFYYDARGAGAEERKHFEIINKNFSLKSYKTIAIIYYLNYLNLRNADKVFVVSDVLRQYFVKTFDMGSKHFVDYPCLSDSSRFFYDYTVRTSIRKEMGINDKTKVFIYAGGTSRWHMTDKLFEFFNEVLERLENCFFLFLTKNQKDIEKYLKQYPNVRQNIKSFPVNNNDIYQYYNAADFGLLLRHNTIMNNVASPTKFAEYILCGLPVIISEGVGDYSKVLVENGLGFQILENELFDLKSFDFSSIIKSQFDRQKIAEFGKNSLSKDSAINYLVKEIQGI